MARETPSTPRERAYTLPNPSDEGVVRVRRDGRLLHRTLFQGLPVGGVEVRIPPWEPWEAVPPLLEREACPHGPAQDRARAFLRLVGRPDL